MSAASKWLAIVISAMSIPIVVSTSLDAAEPSATKVWTRHPAPMDAPLHRVFFLDDQAGWILTYGNGMLLSTTNGGETWKVQARFEANFLETVQFLDTKHGWVTGDYGTAYRTVDGGATWKNVGPPVQDLLAKPLEGQDRHDIKELGWSQSYYQARFVDPRQGRLWAFRYHTKDPRETRGEAYYATQDAGETWTELENWPEIPPAQRWREKPQGGGKTEFFLDTEHGWRTNRKRQLERTTDGGQTWITSEFTNPKVWMWRHVVFLDKKRGYLLGDVDRETGEGVIHQTLDGGVTWHRLGLEVPAPHAAAVAPSRLWIVGKQGLLLSRGRP